MKGKKIISALLVVLMILSMLSGCDAESSEETSAPRDSVVTTEPTTAPTETVAPTEEPTEAPTEEPTEAPTEAETEASTEVPTEEPTEAPTELEFTVSAINKTMYVIQWANIRTGPGTSYDRITALVRGTAVQCVGVASNGWYKIKYNGGEAYIAGNLVSDTKPVDQPAETEPPATETPTTEPPAEHEHSYTETVIAPTCTKDGYTQYTCNCGYTYNGAITKATGHNYNITNKTTASCYVAGEVEYTCGICGEIKTETKSPTEHSYKYNHTFFICGETASDIYDCATDYCEDGFMSIEVEPPYAEHDIDENGMCKQCGITVSYITEATEKTESTNTENVE